MEYYDEIVIITNFGKDTSTGRWYNALFKITSNEKFVIIKEDDVRTIINMAVIIKIDLKDKPCST